MTTDVVEIAIQRYLRGISSVTDVVASARIWRGHVRKVNSKAFNVSGQNAIVIRQQGGPSPGANTLKNPRLELGLYSDHTRNVSGEITTRDARDRMQRIFNVVDPVMHWVNFEKKNIEGLSFINSLRGAEPRFVEDDDQGMDFLWVPYDMIVNM